MTRKILPILCFGFLQALEVQEPVAVVMGPVTEQGVRFSVMANRSAQLAYAALQYRIAGDEDWSETQITPLPRALDNVNALDLSGLVPARRYEYRCGVFYIELT